MADETKVVGGGASGGDAEFGTSGGGGINRTFTSCRWHGTTPGEGCKQCEYDKMREDRFFKRLAALLDGKL